jgi:N-hydroxyarylamine O-acetyltransferase
MPSGSCFRVKDALDAYLSRIGFEGDPMPTLATLKELHRRHVQAVAYENLDVQLGRPVSRNPRAAFRKIVEQRRGGWCHEMNGLFGFMLEAIGFRVQRLAAGVLREQMGEAAVGNHLALVVKLDRLYLADVGLGNGLIEPIPLVEGAVRQGFKRFALERVGGGWWRFHNHEGASPASFDFSLAVTDDTLLEARSRLAQTDPASPFVANAIVQRQFEDHSESLVGTIHTFMAAEGTRSFQIDSPQVYARILRENFGLEIRDVAALWARVSGARRADRCEMLEAAA